MKNIYITIILATCMLLVKTAHSQISNGTNTATGAVEYVGWNTLGTSKTLDIKNNSSTPNNIDFYISATKFLQVLTGGDLNIVRSTNGYQINNNYVLWHNDDPTSIFVGVGAGASQPSSSTFYNTLVGNNAGNALNNSEANTLIGTDAGKSLIDNVHANVALGYQALYSNEHWGRNTAIGYKSLYSLNTACGPCDQGSNLNTAVGYESLYNSQAYGGCALGFWAGYSNTLGCSIIAIGEESMFSNLEGNDNNALGEAALHQSKYFNDNVAIGTSALFSQGTSYSSSTVGSTYNVAVGNDALYSNDPVNLNYDGINNSALGHASLYSNTTGSSNTGCGFQSGYSNQKGNFNVTVGVVAGYSNTTSHATFVGFGAGKGNTTGSYNSFVGYASGYANTTGGYNSFFGLSSGVANTTGSTNSGIGLQVLGQNTTGSCNSGIGYNAGYTNTTGSYNTFVGCRTDANAGNYTNCGAFGSGAIATASNMIEIGNTAVTSIGGYAGWTNFSDGRFKINVAENVSGLEFIKRLRPVTYNLDVQALNAFINPNMQSPTPDSLGFTNNSTTPDYTTATNIVHSGFIAQEVEQAELASGFTSSIVHAPSNANDPYALSYAEFVVPLVKAVQQLDSVNVSLQDQVNALQSALNTCCSVNRTGSSSPLHENNSPVEPSNSGSIDLQNLQTLQLLEADPNPFSESTIIRWNIPNDFIVAMIYFYDYRGEKINFYKITQKGYGELQVFGSKLSSGIYEYSLIVDSKLIDSKKLVKAK